MRQSLSSRIYRKLLEIRAEHPPVIITEPEVTASRVRVVVLQQSKTHDLGLTTRIMKDQCYVWKK